MIWKGTNRMEATLGTYMGSLGDVRAERVRSGTQDGQWPVPRRN